MTDSPKKETPIVEALEVSKVYSAKPGLYGMRDRRFIRAVDRISLAIFPGEIVGLVGESGCGKSTLGRLLIRLTRVSGGTIRFFGEDITQLRGRALRRKRRHMQLIFQDPVSSLNPRYTVRDTLTEAIRTHHHKLSTREQNARIAATLSMVGLPVNTLDRYPGEFSGGERQRIAIARAIAVEPSFVVADEPISALDLSNQAQMVTLLENLRRELAVSFLLISHDLDVVKHLCARVAVMYLGRIIEMAQTRELFARPLNPYTQALIASVLPLDPGTRKKLFVLPGDPPSPLLPPSGCHFHPRCPHRKAQCELLEPPLREVSAGHFSKCHFDF